MRAALRQWRAEQRELLTLYSRKQLLKALVPEAGQSKQKVKKFEEGVSKNKVKALRGHLTVNLRSVAANKFEDKTGGGTVLGAGRE